MDLRYEVIQERYDDDGELVVENYPMLFVSIEDARERVTSFGLPAMFGQQEEGNVYDYHIEELQFIAPDAVLATGRTFPLAA